MNASLRPTALFIALAACFAGCASSPWEKTEKVSSNGSEGRLYVPRLWAPLLPGSIYPDKKAAVPAKGRPAIVVVCPETGDCRKDEILDRAAQRGMVVLVGREPKDDLLRTRTEASAERIGWLLVAPTEDFLGRWKSAGAARRAAAVVGLPPRAGAAFPPFSFSPSSPSQKIFLAALLENAPSESRDGTILKLYSPNKKGLLPSEAFRDAVEWLSGELASR